MNPEETGENMQNTPLMVTQAQDQTEELWDSNATQCTTNIIRKTVIKLMVLVCLQMGEVDLHKCNPTI